MLQAIGLKLADQQFTEVLVAQDIAKGCLCLLENFLPMGNEEKPGLLLLLLEEAFEVKGGDHRLAGAGGGYHQIAPAVVAYAVPAPVPQGFAPETDADARSKKTAGPFAGDCGRGQWPCGRASDSQDQRG